MNKLSVIFFFFFLASCGIKTHTLLNGVTKVPNNEFLSKKYRSISNQLGSTKIDTSGYYFSRSDNSGWISIYKFYSNGKCNWFYTTKEKISQPITYNPDYNGYRGFWYSNKQTVICQLYAPGNQTHQIKEIKRFITVYNDTLYVKREFNLMDTFINNNQLAKLGVNFNSW